MKSNYVNELKAKPEIGDMKLKQQRPMSLLMGSSQIQPTM
ncbi:uncharacterized protein METZ01_LOCUS356563 [marine metagenome]|uniref:Uncharacterized protein n=1 Tax=marine metagenome TaxID=408172 RepID=A0A382S192_9ZZZZ